MSIATDQESTMIDICPLSALTPERGSAALLPDGTQIAVFLLDDGSVHAVQQHDPYSGTNILSRGLVGTHRVPAEGEDPESAPVVPTLASPMFKQVWNLDTGEVIDAGGGEPQTIAVFDVAVENDTVRVATAPRNRS